MSQKMLSRPHIPPENIMKPKVYWLFQEDIRPTFIQTQDLYGDQFKVNSLMTEVAIIWKPVICRASKSMDWFLCYRDLRHERIKYKLAKMTS